MKGSARGQKIAFKSQVASSTKPLASTNEMVDGGNLIIMHKTGGMIKRVNASTEKDILDYIKRVDGESTPATRRGGAFVIDVDVKEKKSIDEEGFMMPKKTAKKDQGVKPMERDLCDDGLNRFRHLEGGGYCSSILQRRA